MENVKNFEEIRLNGYKIQLYTDKLRIYNHNNVPQCEFKAISDKLVQYLMDEAFIPKEKIRVEIVTTKQS